MDFNIAIIAGKLAVKPYVQGYPSGSRSVRFLVTTRTRTPRKRVDVIPVTMWGPDPSLFEVLESIEKGDPIYVAGQIQRRFWAVDEGESGRIEVIANYISLAGEDGEAIGYGIAPT